MLKALVNLFRKQPEPESAPWPMSLTARQIYDGLRDQQVRKSR